MSMYCVVHFLLLHSEGQLPWPIAATLYTTALHIAISRWWKTIDMEVSRLAIVCPCLLRIMIPSNSPRPKSG